MLCAFRIFCNSWNSLHTHTVLVVIVGLYTFESRIHKVAIELPNIIEGLVGVQLCTLFLLQICLTDGSANTTSASGIVPTVRWYYNEIHFQFAFLHLQLQCFSASASPRNQACVTRPSPLVGGSGHETTSVLPSRARFNFSDVSTLGKVEA